MSNVTPVFLIAVLLGLSAPGYAEAGTVRAKPMTATTAPRDCTPINGRHGYYGNPWCDTGSYRLEDIEFRERQRLLRKKRYDD